MTPVPEPAEGPDSELTFKSNKDGFAFSEAILVSLFLGEGIDEVIFNRFQSGLFYSLCIILTITADVIVLSEKFLARSPVGDGGI